MINGIPVLGWLLSTGVAMSLSVPFWICWTACGLGKTYFYFLPERYQAIPFWHCVGLVMIMSFLKLVLTPKLASVEQNNKTANP